MFKFFYELDAQKEILYDYILLTEPCRLD